MASFAALVGQHVVRKVINILGRASIIIFILAATIFVSAISLGMDNQVNNTSMNSGHDMDFVFFFFPIFSPDD